MSIHIRKLLPAAVFALLLCSCGGAEQTFPEETATRTTSATSAVSLYVPEKDDTDADEDAEETDEDDDGDGGDTPEEDNAVAEITLDKDKIDPKKPFTPDKASLGTGKKAYAYPMNGLMLSLYQTPAEGAKRVTRIMIGEEVTLYANLSFSTADYWAYVGYAGEDGKGGFGWCRANQLTEARPDWLYLGGAELPENYYEHKDYNEGVYYINAESAEVKASPNESAETVGNIPRGEDIRAYGDTPSAEGWLFIGASALFSAENSGGYGEIFGWVYVGTGEVLSDTKPE